LFWIFFKTEMSGTRASFCLVVFPRRLFTECFMRQAWLFALAYLSPLPNTVVFVMSALLYKWSNEKRTVRCHLQIHTNIDNLDSYAKSSKYCRFVVTNVGKYGTSGYLWSIGP